MNIQRIVLIGAFLIVLGLAGAGFSLLFVPHNDSMRVRPQQLYQAASPSPTPGQVIYRVLDRPVYKTLSDLVTGSFAVVRVRIGGVAPSSKNSHSALTSGGRSILGVSVPGSTAMRKAAQAAGNTPTVVPSATVPEVTDLPTTKYTVTVVQVIAGTGVLPGKEITVSQPEGLDSAGDLIRERHNPPLVAGQEEIFFLSKESHASSYAILGGGQGRLRITGNNTLQSIDPEAPVTPLFSGKPMDSLIAAIKMTGASPQNKWMIGWESPSS